VLHLDLKPIDTPGILAVEMPSARCCLRFEFLRVFVEVRTDHWREPALSLATDSMDLHPTEDRDLLTGGTTGIAGHHRGFRNTHRRRGTIPSLAAS
jgi:hypothetical protein